MKNKHFDLRWFSRLPSKTQRVYILPQNVTGIVCDEQLQYPTTVYLLGGSSVQCYATPEELETIFQLTMAFHEEERKKISADLVDKLVDSLEKEEGLPTLRKPTDSTGGDLN